MINLRQSLSGALASTAFVLFAGAGSAHALDILNTPAALKERGVEWTQPEMRVGGHGTLRHYGKKYKGDIGCDITVSALRDRHNKVKIKREDGNVDIKAKSNTATVTLSNCIVTDKAGIVTELDNKIVLKNGEVKVKIKGYGIGFDGTPMFDKLKVKGRYDKKHGTVLKIKLYGGTVTPIAPPAATPQGSLGRPM